MRTRFFTLSALAVAAIALLGCNKVEEENIVPQKNGIPFEFTASGVDTKTTNDGVHTNWKSGDQVNLFHAVAGSTTYVSDGAFTADADGASVKFTGTLAGELTAANYDWYAIYPYSSYVTTPASTTAGYLTVGSYATGSQSQTGNSSMAHLAGKNYPVAGKVLGLAKDGKPSIAMTHLTSVVAVKVTNGTANPITVSKVSFTGTESIVGQFFIDFTSTPVVYTERTSYVSSIADLNVTSGTAIAAGENATFYLAVKPFTAHDGETLTLAVTADNGAQSREKSLTADATFAAGTINTLNFTYDKAPASIPEPTSKTGWYRVEKPEWLTAGDRVVIVNEEGTKAMKNIQKDSNRDGVAVTVAEDDIYKKVSSLHDESQIFILETGSVAGSFAFWCENGDQPNKYIYAASSGSNYLKSQDTIDDNASFVAIIVNGVGNLTAQGSNSRKVLQYNGSGTNNLFSCYASASLSDISIYKYYGAWSGSTTCETPTITQTGNTVTISSTTNGAVIYYTSDGTTPDPTKSEQKYTSPFNISSTVTIKAIATRAHYTSSSVASETCEYSSGVVSWTRVTDVATLLAGGTFIMGYEGTAGSGVLVPLRSDATDATTTANGILYSGTGTGTTSNNATIDMSSITETAKYEVTISASSVDGAIDILLATGNYIGNSNGKNTAKVYASTSANTAYKPTLKADDKFELKCEAASTYPYLQYNTGSPRFCNYTGTQMNVVFYKKN